MIQVARAALARIGKPVTIRELRRACPELADYRSLSVCLTDGVRWGSPRIIKTYQQNEYFYTVEKLPCKGGE